MFLVKRVLMVTIMLVLIDLIFLSQRWFVLLGILVGSVLSIFKLDSYVLVFAKVISQSEGGGQYKYGTAKSVLNFIVNQIVVLVLLIITYKMSLWLFAGFVTGILSAPIVIMINGFTEAIKITHNNFE